MKRAVGPLCFRGAEALFFPVREMENGRPQEGRPV